MTQSLTRIFVFIVTILATISVAPAQRPSTTRPPDPAAAAQQPATGFKAPENIDFRTANIISEGVRLHAELFSLKSLAGKPLPTVIQAHGWGGVAATSAGTRWRWRTPAIWSSISIIAAGGRATGASC